MNDTATNLKPANAEPGKDGAVGLQRFVRQARHKWFSALDRRCDDGWYGPHDTIEAAVIECACNHGLEAPIFVGQGYKLSKHEKEEWGAEFDWQVNVENSIEVRLPNDVI